MTRTSSSDENDKMAILVGGLLILLVGVYFIGKNIFFNKKEQTQTAIQAIADKKEGVPLIAPDVLMKKIQNSDRLVLIDVRPAESFQAEHLPHSLSAPIGSLENFFPNKDETAVIIFSESDPATFEAAKNIMSQKSFAYFFLKGGFESWKTTSAPTISVGDPNSFIDQSKVTYIKTEEYKKLTEQNNRSVFVLDVQTEDNFKKKHLKGAVNIPLNNLEKRVGEIPPGKQIVVYGENDLVSFHGGVRLSDLGIFSARALNSGGKNYFSTESPLPLEP
jgi:rhodanese-related sulfurtransferase